MPSIKEKLEASSAAAPPWPHQGNGADPVAWHAWHEEHNKLSLSLEAQAYNDARATEHDAQIELSRATMDRDKAQKAVDVLEAKLKVATHVVAVLGSVEVL